MCGVLDDMILVGIDRHEFRGSGELDPDVGLQPWSTSGALAKKRRLEGVNEGGGDENRRKVEGDKKIRSVKAKR